MTSTLLIFALIAGSFIQAGESDLVGMVIDPSGAAIPAASVIVLEEATERRVSSETDAGGYYRVAHLRPGSYTVIAGAPGFETLVRTGIRLAVGETVRIDLDMQVGEISSVVTVASEAPVLRTEAGSLGQVITNQKIAALPLNGRNFVSLVALSAGVALPEGSAFPRINGGRPRTNEYLYDGISVLQPEPGQVAFFPIIDAIETFRVETNSPSAEFGRFNGGVINLSTRSGTNELHGTVFDFFRHEGLNARNLFAPGRKPQFRRNQFGFVLGGPIAINRTFFFTDYQGTRQNLGQVRTSTVPTLTQRQGIFTEPVAGRVPRIVDPAAGVPFPGNVIPVSRMDRVALWLLDRYPLPNLSGTANNYVRVGNERQNQDQFDVRLDHMLGGSDRLFFRYSEQRDVTDPAMPLPDGSGIASGALGKTHTHGIAAAGNYVRVFSSRLANQARLGYTSRNVERRAMQLASPVLESLGLSGIPVNGAFERTLPTFTITGYQQLGPSANANADSRTSVVQFFDVLSHSAGRRSIKAGLDFRWERLDITQPSSPTGRFRFTNGSTSDPADSASGSALAGFLLGHVEDFAIDLQHDEVRPRARTQEFFIQHAWKPFGRLTVNTGLRYTLNFPSTEKNDQSAVFDLKTEKLTFAGRDGIPRAARKLHKTDFGPRLGVALLLDGRTVLRSGYGLVFIEQAGITTPFTAPNFPFIQSISQPSPDGRTPAFILSAGPNVAPLPLTPDAGLGQGVFTVDRDLGSGYAQQWNLTVQRELDPNTSLEIGYAGSKITRVGIPDTNVNQLTAGQLAIGPSLLDRVPNPFFGRIPGSSSIGGPTVTRAQLLKPFPRFTAVSFYRQNVGNTNYHSLQVRLERRFSSGFAFLVSYTRSKLIDEASSVFDSTLLTGPVAGYPVADSFNRKLERDVSTGDIPNAFVSSYVWDLPRRWRLAGVVTLQSGTPLAVTQATDFNAFAGFGTPRPNRVGPAELNAGQRTAARFFNTDAFQFAPQFTIGNSSRNPVRGPAFRSADLALVKVSTLTERATIEFRVEAFNLTNTPPLGVPDTILGTPSFGTISSAGSPRVLQVALKIGF